MSNQVIRKPLLTKEIIAELRAAATTYRSTRRRSAIHDFLEAIYCRYWAIRKSAKLKVYKAKLKAKAKLPAGAKASLSYLLLKVASAEFDRRDVHRWKSLLEAAFASKAYAPKPRAHVVRRADSPSG